ncbi:hypothetical protein BCON_0098g00250 [Botryotinia convoluta]|uniref:Uncharacterized protein n=1 Tax=Botryotinia convoluta TaxID=54673 RepID=A0A4Z1IE11_9HELO|nr:hypothetical protein BCON_0098g00250 [Botryotinia convoluta]
MNETSRERRIFFRPPVRSSLHLIKSTNTPPLKESQEETPVCVAEYRVAVRDDNIASQNPPVLLRSSQKTHSRSEDSCNVL